MVIQNHDPVVEFEKKYASLRSDCVESFADGYERFHGAYSVNPTGRRQAKRTASLSTAAFGDMRVAVTRWNSAIRGTVLSEQEHFCLRFPLAGSAKTFDPNCGLETTGPDQFGVFRSRQGVTVEASPENAAINLAIPARLLEERARSYADASSSAPLTFGSQMAINSPTGAAVAGMINCMFSQLVTAPEAFDNRLICTSMSELVVSTLLGVLPHNHQCRGSTKQDVVVPHMVKRAEDYMRAHAEQPLTLQMIAGEAGCSERALQKSFKAFRGKTPMAALREIRLENARLEIEQSFGSVTDVALKWGFSNLGRFSAQYADKFGEYPSRSVGTAIH